MLFRAPGAVVPRDRWLSALSAVASGHLGICPLFLSGHWGLEGGGPVVFDPPADVFDDFLVGTSDGAANA